MFVLAIPPSIVELVQSGLIERAFHDALYPELKFRSEASFEEWPAGTGTELYMSRPGLLTPNVTPLRPGVDPIPQTLNWEQFRVVLERYGDTIDTDTQTSGVAVANLFHRNTKQLGLQAGQSMNRLARNALFKPYLAGMTALTVATAAVDLTMHVASLNGFNDMIVRGTDVKPTALSTTHVMVVTVGAVGNFNVVGTIPDDANDPDGPGYLVLDAAVGSIIAARTSVLSPYAPMILRVGGGTSVDSLGTADTFTMQYAIVAANLLRNNSVPSHDDGLYHAHIAPLVNAQAFSDAGFQRLFTSLPDAEEMKKGVLGTVGNVKFILNPENPQFQQNNVGTLTSTGAGSSLYGKEVGAEVMNTSGIPVGRTIVTGKGALYERGLDEKAYQTEAGVTGKIGQFEIANNGVGVNIDRIQLIIRAPLNRTQNMVASTWTCSTGFCAPSDACSGNLSRHKRAVVIECAT